MATIRTQAQIQTDITNWTNTLNTRKTAKVACPNNAYKYITGILYASNANEIDFEMAEKCPTSEYATYGDIGNKIKFISWLKDAQITKNKQVNGTNFHYYVNSGSIRTFGGASGIPVTFTGYVTCAKCGVKLNVTSNNAATSLTQPWLLWDDNRKNGDLDRATYRTAMAHGQVLQYTDAQRTEAQNNVTKFTNELNEAKQRDTIITNFTNLNKTVNDKSSLSNLKSLLDQIGTYSGVGSTIHKQYEAEYIATATKVDLGSVFSLYTGDTIPGIKKRNTDAYEKGLVEYKHCRDIIDDLTDY